MFDVVFTGAPITNYRGVLKGDPDLARRFNMKLRARGILKGDTKYYVSLAHDERDIAHTIATWGASLGELAVEPRS
jgi:glutamate-1-semialdehyde 2,1-aminomutase